MITHVYPAVLEGRSVLSQSQDEQPHVVLFAPPQTEAEAPLAALQLHHEAALRFTDTEREIMGRGRLSIGSQAKGTGFW